MRHLERVQHLARRMHLPEHRRLRVATNQHGMVYVQIEGWVRDLTDPHLPGEHSWQRGGKAYVSEHACDSEFFQMVLDRLIAFDEHEIREAVTVDGRRVFNPHLDVEALKSIAHVQETRTAGAAA